MPFSHDLTSFLSPKSLTMDLALWVSVLITLRLCSKGWLLSKFKYWSVWVTFLNTLVQMVPSSLITSRVSRKTKQLSTFFSMSSTSISCCTSPSVVHLMSSSIVFKYSVKACAWSFFKTVYVSSTYLFHQQRGITCLSQRALIEVLHIYVAHDWRDWRTH